MREWLQLTRIDSAEQAGAALRLGDIALIASAPLGVLSAMLTNVPPDLAANVSFVPATSPEERVVLAEISALMPQIIRATAIVMALITLVLAAVQWRYRTWIIPAICLGLVGYSLIMLPLSWSNEAAVMMRAQRPVWLTALDIGSQVAGLAMFWAAFRGGRWLERRRREKEEAAIG